MSTPASKIAVRELRAAPAKFAFVVVAVAVGVAALSGVKGFGFAFRGMLLRNARQLIAADVQAQTWNCPDAEDVARMNAVAHWCGEMTRVTETVSMAASNNQRVPQMVSVKGVDSAVYPYYGTLGVDPARPLASLLSDDASAVVTPELLLRFKVHRGDTLRIGGKEFRIKGTLTSEPDRLASGFGPGMRVLVSRAGLDRTGLIQFGSRAAQRFLFKLKPGVNLDAVKARIQTALPHVFISDYREGSPVVGRAIDNTTTFLSLVSLIALIVGALGVAMAMYSHIQQRMDTIAVMKAIGARASQVMRIYVVQTLWLGVVGGVLGVAAGALVQRSFPWLIQRVFKLLPQVPWDWSFSAQGLSLGVLATLLFTAPPLLGIRNVRPNLVLRRHMDDAARETRKRWRERAAAGWGALLIAAGFGCIAVWVSGSWKMGLYFVAGLAVSILLLAGVAALLLETMRWTVRAGGSRLPATFRHGFANLYRPGNQARSVLVALGVGVVFTVTTYLLQATVLDQVAAGGLGREGNVFLLDVRNAQELRTFLAAQPGTTSSIDLVGYVVAKLLDTNAAAPKETETLRVVMAGARPRGVQVRKGHWWQDAETHAQIAVSDDARDDMNLKLGDVLRLQIAGRVLTAPVTSIFHQRDRGAIRYRIVMPGEALHGFPAVYYGAAHVQPSKIPAVEEALFERFPTVTVMNLADVMARINEAVDQVALVIRFLALFAIVAGVIILCSSVAGTRYRRIREVAVLKALGATPQRIVRIFSVEFSVLGAVSGLVGAILANVFTRIVASRFLNAPFDFSWLSLLAAMLGTALIANIAGWLASARIRDRAAAEVLRGE